MSIWKWWCPAHWLMDRKRRRLRLSQTSWPVYPYISLALFSFLNKMENGRFICISQSQSLYLFSMFYLYKMGNVYPSIFFSLFYFLLLQDGKWQIQLKMSVPLYNPLSLFSFSKMDNGKCTVYPYIPYISERILFSPLL